MAHPDAIAPPSERYTVPPPDAEIPMTAENLDPTKPVPPIRGFSSPVDAASYWTVTNGAIQPRKFAFAVQELCSRGDFSPVAYTVVALSEMVSTMRGHGGNLLFATGVPIKDTEDEKRAYAHRGSLRWSLIHYITGAGDPRELAHMRNLPVSGIEVVLGGYAYTSEKMIEHSSGAITEALAAMGQGGHERIIVFVYAGYPEMRELQRLHSSVALFADHDGRFPPEAIRAERAILVVGVRGWTGYDRAEPERLTNQEKLYALVQMDAAWRFLHLFSPARVERMELATPLDEFSVDILNTIESYAGREIPPIAAVRSEYDRMGRAAVEAEIRNLQRRLGRKRRPPPPSDRVTRSRARHESRGGGEGPSVAFGGDE